MAVNYQISVRPVVRFIVVEYLEDADDPNGVRGGSEIGEFDGPRHAEEAAAARGAWRQAQEDSREVQVIAGFVGVDDLIESLRDPDA